MDKRGNERLRWYMMFALPPCDMKSARPRIHDNLIIRVTVYLIDLGKIWKQNGAAVARVAVGYE